MSVVPAAWSTRLAAAMAATVREYAARRLSSKPIVAFNVGCFPWHGRIELSILTADELDSDPVLMEPGEIAAWLHYNIGVGLSSWEPVMVSLGGEMSAAYSGAAGRDKVAVTEAFLRACAEAAGRPEVAEALGSVGCDPRFRITVDHPDDGRDRFAPDTGA